MKENEEYTTKMKLKAIAYATVAVILGFIVMMVPVAIKPSSPASTERFTIPFDGTITEHNGVQPDFGFASQPKNLLPASVVPISGLIVALGIYVGFKKKTQ